MSAQNNAKKNAKNVLCPLRLCRYISKVNLMLYGIVEGKKLRKDN